MLNDLHKNVVSQIISICKHLVLQEPFASRHLKMEIKVFLLFFSRSIGKEDITFPQLTLQLVTGLHKSTNKNLQDIEDWRLWRLTSHEAPIYYEISFVFYCLLCRIIVGQCGYWHKGRVIRLEGWSVRFLTKVYFTSSLRCWMGCLLASPGFYMQTIGVWKRYSLDFFLVMSIYYHTLP